MTEVERLMVRVMGDATSAIKAANETIVATQKVERQVEKTTRSVSKQVEDTRFRIGGSIRQFGENALQALAAVGIKRWVEGAVHEFSEAENALTRLNAAMKSNAKAGSETGAVYERFAKDMEKITTVGDDVVTSMLAVAETQGLSGEAAMRAVKNAVALSTASTGSASGAQGFIRQGVMIEQGILTPLRRMIPALRDAKTGEEQAAIATKFLSQGFAQAKEEAGTHAGSLKQLANSYGNFKEEIGKVAAAGMKPFIALLKQTTEWLQTLSEDTKKNIVAFAGVAAALFIIDPLLTLLASLLSPVVVTLGLLAVGLTLVAQQMGGFEALWGRVKEWGLDAWDAITTRTEMFVEWVTPYWEATVTYMIDWWRQFQQEAVVAWQRIQDFAAPVLDWLKTAIVDAFILAEFTVLNFGDSAELEWLRFQRGLVRIAVFVRDVFTVDIPNVFNLFVKNWEQVFVAIEDFTINVFREIFDAIKDIFITVGKSIWSWMWGGAGEDPIGAPVKASIQAAFDTAKTGGWLDEMEKQLSGDIDKLGGSLDNKFEQFRAERLAQLGQLEQGLAGFITGRGGDFGGGGDFGPEVAENIAEKLPQKAKVPKERQKKGGEGDTKFDVAAFGSIEAFSRISAFQDLVAGKTGDPLTSIDEKMTKQNELLQGIKDNQEDGDLLGGDF